jgi:hypothetical protein
MPENDVDPLKLHDVAKMQYAADLIRREHSGDNEGLFWTSVAAYLDDASHMRDGPRGWVEESDWHRFRQAEHIATGYIRLPRPDADGG